MDLDLRGKHALVGGGSQGIGRAAALELASLGASVTLMARDEARLRDAVAGLPRIGEAEHGYVVADVGQPDEAAARVAHRVMRRTVNILVNNTGGPPSGPALTAAADGFVTAFRQHLLANHALLQAVLPEMRASGYGRVINVISTSVREPIPNLGVSNTVRGAVASWAKTLAGELGPFGITVNNVLPGYTRTGRLDQIVGDRARAQGKAEQDVANAMIATVPLRRFAEAAEVAQAIAFLAAPAAAYITGVSLAVDGGRMQSI